MGWEKHAFYIGVVLFLAALVSLAYLIMSAQGVFAQCYTPSQTAAISQMAENLNMSNLTLMMIFETACDKYTRSETAAWMNATDAKINASLAAITYNESYIINVTNNTCYMTAKQTSEWLYANYTSFVNDKIQLNGILTNIVTIANSSSQISGIDGMVAAARAKLQQDNMAFQDEITKSMGAYISNAQMASITDNMTNRQNNIEARLYKIESTQDNTPWGLIIIIIAVLAGGLWFANRNGWLAGGDDTRKRLIASLPPAGTKPRTTSIYEMNQPSSDGESLHSEIQKSKKLKARNIEREAERMKRIEAALKSPSKHKKGRPADDDEDEEDEDEDE
jgi:hypothetical protein